jgi:hypothetical protein
VGVWSPARRPTEDKRDVTFQPPSDPHLASAFMNIRVADIHAKYKEWSQYLKA